MNRTNEQWLSALQSSGTAFDAAIADLRQILVAGLQRGLLGHVNTSAPEFESLAEDFVQEALLKITDNLDTFAGRSQFTTWAHKIALSVALTELRRKRWQDKSLDGIMDVDEGDFTPSYAADRAPLPDNQVERIEMMSRVERLIREELTDKQRAALTAIVIEERSATETAEILDMKANAVYKLLHDARLRLKRRLLAEGLTSAEVLSVFS